LDFFDFCKIINYIAIKETLHLNLKIPALVEGIPTRIVNPGNAINKAY